MVVLVEVVARRCWSVAPTLVGFGGGERLKQQRCAICSKFIGWKMASLGFEHILAVDFCKAFKRCCWIYVSHALSGQMASSDPSNMLMVLYACLLRIISKHIDFGID